MNNDMVCSAASISHINQVCNEYCSEYCVLNPNV